MVCERFISRLKVIPKVDGGPYWHSLLHSVINRHSRVYQHYGFCTVCVSFYPLVITFVLCIQSLL